jgi:hypothetical protein
MLPKSGKTSAFAKANRYKNLRLFLRSVTINQAGGSLVYFLRRPDPENPYVEKKAFAVGNKSNKVEKIINAGL